MARGSRCDSVCVGEAVVDSVTEHLRPAILPIESAKVWEHLLRIHLPILSHAIPKDTSIEIDIAHGGDRSTVGVFGWGFSCSRRHVSQHPKFQCTVMIPEIQSLEIEVEQCRVAGVEERILDVV